MKFVALLRGINVGGNKKVEMKRLKAFFESLGFTNVSTYINSGNIIFESDRKQNDLQEAIAKNLKKEFGFTIDTLVKTQKEIKAIAKAIPENWKNDSEQKTDVAYLFKEIDSPETVDVLSVKRELLTVKYVKGAIVWNVQRKDLIKSRLSKVAAAKMYQLMTVRNVNTARFLAGDG